MPPLSDSQLQSYEEQGYLLASGLIPSQVSAGAERAMWRLLGLSLDDPGGWPHAEPGHHVYADPALVAVYTPELCAAAAQLAGDDPAIFRPPGRAYTINLFPTDAEWRWPAPHIDHAIREAGHRVFPRAFRVACMVYLSDVPPHGGGTIVWPGSHRQLEALAKSDPGRYQLMWTLNQELRSVDLRPPVELAPRRGDVLFYHYLCAHAGSLNASARPRFALNMKW